MEQIANAKVTVELTIEQVVAIRDSFDKNIKLEKENAQLKQTLQDVNTDLNTLVSNMYITTDETNTWVRDTGLQEAIRIVKKYSKEI